MRKNTAITVIATCLVCFWQNAVQACPTNDAPIAIIAGGNRWVAPGANGAKLTFNGSNSYDPDSGTISFYRWTFTNNATEPPTAVTISGSTKSSAEYTFTGEAGTTYIVSLLVRDGLWAPSQSVSVTVTLREPITWYVAPTGVDNIESHGRSWAIPFATLQMALDSASSGDEIRMAAGTYIPRIPTEGDARLASFHRGEGLYIYGGFAGQGDDPDARNISANLTTLSGDLEDNDGEPDYDRSDNCYRVISCYRPARIDGFTITGGNADATGRDNGAAFRGKTTFTNCIFRGNYASYGAAISTVDSPTFINCLFEDNHATATDGGAIWFSGGAPELENCVFRGNAAGRDGGAIWATGGAITLKNCTISENTASGDGAGVHVADGTVLNLTNCLMWGNCADGNGGAICADAGALAEIRNCTVVDNNASLNGGGIYRDSGAGSVAVKNSIIWGNIGEQDSSVLDSQVYVWWRVAVEHSCVGADGCTEGAFNGDDNIALDPEFIRPGQWQSLKTGDDVVLRATIRDFLGRYKQGYDGNDLRLVPGGHPDFENMPGREFVLRDRSYGPERGIVGGLGSLLSATGKPQYNYALLGDTGEHPDPNMKHDSTHGKAAFDQWFIDDANVNQAGVYDLILTKTDGDPNYRFNRIPFYPIDEQLFDTDANNRIYTCGTTYHNFHFTMEFHATFDWYGTSETFEVLVSDDDLFLYIDGRLVMDLGGINEGSCTLSINSNGDVANDGVLTGITLAPGRHSLDVFYAERHADGSKLSFATTLSFNDRLIPGDYHLAAGSSCIDAGLDTLIPQDTTTDIEGSHRIFDVPGRGDADHIVDMGAYEFSSDINNLPPVAGDDTATTMAGTPIEIDVLANDSDPDPGDTILLASWTDGMGGTVSSGENGALIYEPAEWFVGEDTFSYTIEDSNGLAAKAQVIVKVIPLLEVYAGADRTISSATTEIQIDDAFVRGDPNHSITWSVAYAPVGCNVTITPNYVEHPSVSLDVNSAVFAAGKEVEVLLRLTAMNGSPAYSAYDDVWIRVEPSLEDQATPVVSITCGAVEAGMANLTGIVTDDGLPFGQLFYRWEVLQAPNGGTVYFTDLSNKDTAATFTEPGTYLVRLTASDGQKEGSAVAAVQVEGQAGRLAVYAGEDTSIAFQGSSVTHAMTSAYVKRGGVDIAAPAVNIQWRVIGGPAASVMFNDPTAIESSVTFTAASTYVLQLEASGAVQTAFDEVVLDVNDMIFDANYLVVDAGPDLIAGQFEVATLRGKVEKASGTLETDWEQSVGEPDSWVEDTVTYTNGEGISVTWSVVSGPGMVELMGFDADEDEHPDANSPHVRFHKAGDYVLKLEVQRGAAQYIDIMTVTVPSTQVAIGDTHMLALDSAGVVWGRGVKYILDQPGEEAPTDSNVYVIAFEKIRDSGGNELSGIAQVAAGIYRSFAVEQDSGHILAFGDNTQGHLGIGTEGGFVKRPSMVRKADGQPLGRIVKVAATGGSYEGDVAFSHVLTLDGNGIVRSWGCNLVGQLGIGSLDNGRKYPSAVLTKIPEAGEPNEMLKGIVDIDAGINHSVALDANGNVWTWGDNSREQLGNGSEIGSCLVARQVRKSDGNLLSGVVDIAATSDIRATFFAVDRAGYVWFWGQSLEHGSTSVTEYPTQVSNGEQDVTGECLSNVIAVSAGHRHAMFLTRDGRVLTLGGPLKSLGIGLGLSGDNIEDGQWRETPVYVRGSEGFAGSRLEDIVSIDAHSHTCIATDSSGRVWQWGHNYWGTGDMFGYSFAAGWTPDWGDFSLRVPRELGLGCVTNERKLDLRYDTIQRAVDDAISGDTLVVHPGIYRRFAIPSNKHITIRSIDPGSIDTISQTVVCGAAYGVYGECDCLNDVVVTIEYPNSSEIQGLTITGGAMGVLSGVKATGYTGHIRHYVIASDDADSYDSPTISRCRIVNNLGTGIMCRGAVGRPLIENNWINGVNTSPNCYPPTRMIEHGNDGIYCKSPDAIIRNNTIVDKSGYGVRYDGGEPNLAIYNCILWRNNGSGSLAGPQSLNCSEVGCFSLAPENAPGFLRFAESSPTCSNTHFVDDFHLRTGSPCIDAGDDSGTYEGFDIDGQPRVMGDCIDIGADEFSEWSVYAGVDKTTNKDQLVLFADAKLRFDSNDIDLGIDQTALWTITSKPDGSDPNLQNWDTLNLVARFDRYGLYELRLDVRDSNSVLLGSDTVQVNVGPRIGVVASPRKLVLPSSSSNLTGTVEGWDPNMYRTEWSSDTPSVAGITESSTEPLAATADIAAPGVYTITMKVLDRNTGGLVGSASAMIVATRSGVIVEAGDDQEVPPDYTVRLSGSVIGSADCDVQWHFPDGATNHGDTGTIQTWVRFKNAGIYEVLLKATSGDRFIDADILTITVSEGRAAMDTSGYDAGSDKEIRFLVDPDPAMDANVDNTCPAFDRLEWRLNGLSVSDSGWGAISSQGRLDPTVSFRQPGKYSLLMSLYDADILVGHDTVLVTVSEPQGIVTAKISDGVNEYDEFSRVLDGGSASVSLVGRSMIWVPGAAEYEWSSDRPEAVSFTGFDWWNKTAVISSPGIHHITLTARRTGETTIIGRDTVTLAVFRNETLCSTGHDYGRVLAGSLNALSLSKAFVWTDGSMWYSGKEGVTWTCAPLSEVSFDDQHAIQPHVTFGTPGIYTLTMSYGNISDSVNIVVENPLLITNFTVEPTTLTSPSQEMIFAATMDEVVESWMIDVLAGSNAVVGTLSGTGNSISETVLASNIGILTSGTYTVRLTARAGDVTDVYYEYVVLNTTVNSIGLVAKLDDVFHDKDVSEADMPAKHVISDGTCDILGKAYSTTGNDVYYSIIAKASNGSTYRVIPAPGEQGDFRYGTVGDANNLGELGTADLTSLPNGVYDIVLTVKYDIYYASDEGQFILSSPLKIGNLTFSQEDLAIPVGGYPISIIRTYDSLAKDIPGDFGYGWSYSFADMDIQLNEEREGTCRYGGAYDRDVTLTLPDGTRAAFASHFDYAGSQWTVNYDPPPGVTARLETLGHDKIVNGGGLYGVGYFWRCDEDNNDDFKPSGSSPEPVDLSLHDFSGFTLTMPDGTVYNIARHPYGLFAVNDVFMGDDDEDMALYKFQSYGKPYLSSIDLSTGERIVFDVDLTDPENPLVKGAKRYLAGQNTPIDAILLERTGNRITAVYPPSETEIVHDIENSRYVIEPKDGAIPYVKYDYDTVGNLKSVLRLKERPASGDPVYETITYSYSHDVVMDTPQNPTKVLYKQCQPSEHRITAITDARGIGIIKYHYDPSGLLAATEDASGGAIKIVHNKSEMKETITDRMGNVSEYQYDSRGRVLSETKGIATTSYVYGSYSAITYTYGTSTYPVEGEQEGYSNAYADKPCMTTDPAGGVTYYRYDGAGRMTRVIDPELNKTVNTYDDRGNLEATAQYRPKLNASGEIDVSSNKVQFDEVSASRSYYTDDKGLLYLSGTTTGDGESRVWHSASFTTYDDKNRVVRSVQLDVQSSAFVSAFADGGVLEYAELDEYDTTGCPVTTYAYEKSISNSTDQPSSVTDASGATTYFHYNEQGAQDASWYESTGADGLPRRVTSTSQFDEMGRVTTTHRIVEKLEDSVWTEVYDILLGTTVYNSIGKVDESLSYFEWSADGDVYRANLTRYFYDKTGNLVETWSGLRTKAAAAEPVDTWLTVSQTLYDKEGRTLVSVGPYEPAIYDDPDITKWPVGSETVYDSLGRVSETRRWAGVAIQLENVVSRGKVVGKQAVVPVANAYTTTPPSSANLGWTSNGKLPVAKAAVNAGEQGPLSYSRSIYDEAGRVKHSITLDETGAEQPTSYIYDKAGKQLVIIDPLGHTMALATNNLYGAGIILANGTAAQKIDFGAFSWDTYDETNKPQGNLTGTHQTTTHYDGQQRDSVTDARGNTTYFGYDDAGRLIWTRYPQTEYVAGYSTDGSPTIGTNHTYTHTGYNSMGQRAWESEQTTVAPDDSAGLATINKKEFGYDTSGRLTTVTLPAVDDPEDSSTDLVQPVYRYYYNDYGNQTAILDPKGRTTIFEYDEQNRQRRAYMPYQVTFTDPAQLINPAFYPDFDTIDDIPASQKFTESHYDDYGRTDWQADYKGQVTGFFYDSHGRLEYKKLYTDMAAYSAQTPSQTIRYTYDALGRRDKVYVDNVLSEEYGYTADGSLDYITYSGIGTVNYEYDPITGQKLRTVADDGAVTDTQSTYDDLGRLATVRGKSDAVAAEYGYDAVGSRESLKYANGNFAQHNYDQLNRLTSLINYQTRPIDGQPTPPVLSSFGYGLLPNGRRAYAGETDHTAQQTAFVWAYDDLGRLETETCRQATNPANLHYEQAYIYDIVGNRKERVVSTYNSSPVKTGEIVTAYNYYPGTDRLHEEINDHTVACVATNPDGTVYACATGGGISYFGGDGSEISSFRAWLLGMPTKWSRYMFVLLLTLIPIIPVSPLIGRLLRGRKGQPVYAEPAIWRKCMCVLLAYCILMGPGVGEALAVDSSLYTNLCAGTWGADGTTIVYQYDDNGSVTEKRTITTGSAPEEIISRTAYIYDLAGRLAEVQEKNADGTTVLSWTKYSYNDDGIRIRSEDSSSLVRTFLVDPANGTGYTQVLEEYDGTTRTSYVIGDDVLAQKAGTSQPQYLLYDGHGSTRQVSTAAGAVAESYSYDAYGMAVGFNPSTAATSLLYTGEQYDSSLSQYYLRARYYDPSNGRFTQTDSFEGNNDDPQSLHKYTYCHDDPIGNLDLSGLSIIDESGGYPYNMLSGIMVHAIFYVLASLHGGYYNTPINQIIDGNLIDLGLSLLRPDAVIEEGPMKGFYELKPITNKTSPSLARRVDWQMKLYDRAFKRSQIKRGDSEAFLGVVAKMPVGYIRRYGSWWEVVFYPGTDSRVPIVGSGEGLVYYSLTKVDIEPPKGGDGLLRPIAVPESVKENIRIPRFAPITAVIADYRINQTMQMTYAYLLAMVGVGVMIQSAKPGMARAYF